MALFDDGTQEIIGACIEVHRHLGPGLLEQTYEHCLCHELWLRGIAHERHIAVPLRYKDVILGAPFRIDLVVKPRILVEAKAVERLTPIHIAQVLTYLRIADLETGLLVNFNVPVMKQGLRRLTRPRGPVAAEGSPWMREAQEPLGNEDPERPGG